MRGGTSGSSQYRQDSRAQPQGRGLDGDTGMREMWSNREGALVQDRGHGSHLKEGDALEHPRGAAHLPDGVHGQLWAADVQHAQPQAGGQNGADGGSTGRVVAHHELLHGDTASAAAHAAQTASQLGPWGPKGGNLGWGSSTILEPGCKIPQRWDVLRPGSPLLFPSLLPKAVPELEPQRRRQCRPRWGQAW